MQKVNARNTAIPQGKNWCYTLNNPQGPIEFNEDTMHYLVYGEEVGESGTPHHQGYVAFKNRRRLNQCKELSPRAHWEIARGSHSEASDYCKKDGVFKEFGKLPEDAQKKASKAGAKANSDKWRNISDHAKAGDLSWIDNNYPKPFVNSYRNLVAIRKDFTQRLPDLDGVCGIWYYGEPGVGKTRLVTLKYPNAYLKRMNKWFDGYNMEDVVVMDDFGKDHAYMGYELKKLADRYCYMVEVKNASMYIRPKKCVVTSQYKIEDIWAEDDETKKALQRRFVQVEVVKDNIELSFAIANERLNQKNGIVEKSTPSIPNEQQLEANEITAEEFDSVMEKFNAKPVTLDVIEKMPKKLQPTNKYYPDKPLRFMPYTKKFKTPRLIRKNAFVKEKKKEEEEVLDISTDEDEVMEEDKEAPSLHDYYDLEAEEVLDDSSETPSDVDDSE